MQSNPFETNPKGRRSPLFSDDDETETPVKDQRPSITRRPGADLRNFFSQMKPIQRGKNQEDVAHDNSPEPTEEVKNSQYNVPKFLLSNEFATVRQFNQKHPIYSKENTQIIKSDPMSLADDLTQTLKKLKPRQSGDDNLILDSGQGAKTPPKHEKLMRTTITSVKKERKYNDVVEFDSDTTEKKKPNFRKPSSYEDDDFFESGSEKSSDEKKKLSRLDKDYKKLGVLL